MPDETITKDAMSDCVSEKMKVLMDEDPERDQDQALAIAYEHCGEEKMLKETAVQEKMVMRPTQAEAGYVAVSTTKGKACANCRWFHLMEGAPGCHLIENGPAEIVSNGYCERWEAPPDMPMEEPAPIPVTIVEPEMEMGKTIEHYTSLVQRIKDAVQKSRAPQTPDMFLVYKDAEGRPRWFARHTNNFEDLEGDVFTEKAHDKTIARVNAGLVPMPYLSLWHLQGTEHGRATWLLRDDHLVMAGGTFDETPFAEKCLRYYQKQRGQIKLSLGAFVPKWARTTSPDIRRRVFTDYNTLHITTLPPVLARAANPYTTFSEDMSIMALKSEQKAFLVKEFGQEEADRIEKDNETLNKTLEQLVQFKDFVDLVTKAEDKPAADVTNHTAASLFRDLVEGQALVVRIAEGVAKHQTDTDAQVKAANEAVEALRKELEIVKASAADALALLKQTPRRASQDAATALSDVEAAQVKKDIPVDVDTFWGNMGIPKEVK